MQKNFFLGQKNFFLMQKIFFLDKKNFFLVKKIFFFFKKNFFLDKKIFFWQKKIFFGTKKFFFWKKKFFGIKYFLHPNFGKFLAKKGCKKWQNFGKKPVFSNVALFLQKNAQKGGGGGPPSYPPYTPPGRGGCFSTFSTVVDYKGM